MELYINRSAYWAPPYATPDSAPELTYVSPLLKRRLSQLTRMTIEVVHRVLDAAPDSPLVFVSSCGESARQLQVDRMLIEDGQILPAPFSLSVFNASPAMATIALGMKGGYTALYPAGNLLAEAFAYGAAPILSGETESVILVVGDQKLPDEYKAVASSEDDISPYAAAFVLSSKKQAGSVPVHSYKGLEELMHV